MAFGGSKHSLLPVAWLGTFYTCSNLILLDLGLVVVAALDQVCGPP